MAEQAPIVRNDARRARVKANMASDRTLEGTVGQHVTVQSDGCWIYKNQPDKYHQINGGQLAHRFVYETLIGPIPDGMDLHHRCKKPGCVNPAHLKPVTRSQHTRLHGQERLPGHLAAKLRGLIDPAA